jgi:hypothetical protein
MVADELKSQYQYGQQGAQQIQDGHPIAGAARIATAAVPVLGPMALNISDNLTNPQTRNYGAGQVAGLAASAGLSALIPKAVGPGRATDVLDNSAEQNYTKAINPTTKINKAIVKDTVAPGLAERGVIATSRDDLMAQAQSHLDNYGQQIDDFMQQHGTDKLPGYAIINDLEALKKPQMVGGTVPSVNQPYVQQIGRLQADVAKIMQTQGYITAEDLRGLRQSYDKIAASKGAFALPPETQTALKALTDATNTIRGRIASTYPDLADTNKEYSFWKNVNDVTDASDLRKTGQRQPLTEMMAKTVGAAVGAPGGAATAYASAQALGALAKLKNSMIWNSVSGAAKSRISDLIKNGDPQAALVFANKAAIASMTGKSLLPNNGQPFAIPTTQ